MRVAALYDVHGNLPALEAVLAEVGQLGVDAIVSGGDVLWGPLQQECLDLLSEANALCVRGNCERGVLAPTTESERWCADRLTESDRELVAGWPLTLSLTVPSLGEVLFCHATPRNDAEILTRSTPDDEVREALAGVTADVVVAGHVHVQDDRATPGAPRLVNAGSVGLPYEGVPGACWALLGETVELRRTEHDVERAASVLASAGFPSFSDTFEESVRGLVAAESATAYFEQKRRGA